MYEAFFGLKEKPFSLTPNPRFLFLSKTHNEVYAHLLYGIENKSGFIMVTGEVGTGKTTILRALLKNLNDNIYRLAFIFNPKLTAKELLQNINREFGIMDSAESLPAMIEQLNKFLLDENREGRVPVLVIDEAQNLSGEVLEQIRLLSNLETETDKLIQIVFVGQPELEQQLNDSSLRQLNQRIAVRYRLVPLNCEETAAYIVNRLKVAGRPDGNVFSKSALRKIFQETGGVPRKINLVCDRSMLVASNDECGQVKPVHVRQAVLELSGEHRRLNKAKAPWRPIAVSMLLGAFLIAIYAMFPFDWLGEFVQNPVVAQVPVTDQGDLTPPETKQPAPIISSKITACNAILESWTGEQIPLDLDPAAFDVEDLLQLHNLQVMKLQGTFTQLQQFNLPFILVLEENGRQQYMAITRKTETGWQIKPEPLDERFFQSLVSGEFGLLNIYLPWKDFAEIGYVANPGMRGPQIKVLQQLLSKVGEYNGKVDGVYDRKTIAYVRLFQDRVGLEADGLVGPRTLAALYAASNIYKLPNLY